MKTVLSLSGGVDSTTLYAYLLNQGHEVSPIGIQYGSKHNLYELDCAADIHFFYGSLDNLPVLEMTSIFQQFKSDLLISGGPIPEGHYEDETMKATVVPCRNMIFASILAGYALSIGADSVALGIHAGDHTIYPDCRLGFYYAMRLAIQEASDSQVELIAPFLKMDKASIIKKGLAMDVPYHLTRTCYTDNTDPCGKCGACVERLEAFDKNNIKDPVLYQGETFDD